MFPGMIQFVKMTFWGKKKLSISLCTMNHMIPYKKGAGIVSKPVTVCKNECSAAENTCAQSVVRASFGQNWSAPAQAVLPCSSYEDCHKAQLNTLNTNLQLKLASSIYTAPNKIQIEGSYNIGISEMRRWCTRENLYTLTARNWSAFKSWKKNQLISLTHWTNISRETDGEEVAVD